MLTILDNIKATVQNESESLAQLKENLRMLFSLNIDLISELIFSEEENSTELIFS
jgi:mannose/fructose-specific phosphotransferase system component IIA